MCLVTALDPLCFIEPAVSAGVEAFAGAAGKAAASMIGQGMTFWVGTESVDPNSTVVATLQGYTVPVVATVLVASVLAQSIRVILSRKKDPLIQVAVGLVRFALVSTLGLTVLAAALRAGDE